MCRRVWLGRNLHPPTPFLLPSTNISARGRGLSRAEPRSYLAATEARPPFGATSRWCTVCHGSGSALEPESVAVVRPWHPAVQWKGLLCSPPLPNPPPRRGEGITLRSAMLLHRTRGWVVMSFRDLVSAPALSLLLGTNIPTTVAPGTLEVPVP